MLLSILGVSSAQSDALKHPQNTLPLPKLEWPTTKPSKLPQQKDKAVVDGGAGVLELSLHKHPCPEGTCPTYTILISQDATLHYEGTATAPYPGHQRVKLPQQTLQFIFTLAAALPAVQSPESALNSPTSTASTTLRVVLPDRTVIYSYQEPTAELWGLEQILMHLLTLHFPTS